MRVGKKEGAGRNNPARTFSPSRRCSGQTRSGGKKKLQLLEGALEAPYNISIYNHFAITVASEACVNWQNGGKAV